MKRIFLAFLFMALVVTSCSNKPENAVQNNNERTIDETLQLNISDIGGAMIIVKFSNPSHANYVLAGHPIKGYNRTWGYYEFYSDRGIRLNTRDTTIYGSDMLEEDSLYKEFYKEVLPILGTSPYIPLADGYYLIDWKWGQRHPLSATCHAPQPDGNDLWDIVKEHCFVTDVLWEDLPSLSSQWDNDQFTEKVEISDIRRIPFESIDKYMDQVRAEGEFLCYGCGLYDCGMSVSNVGSYWMYKDSNWCHTPTAYQYCVAWYDSLQNCYINDLKEIISKNLLTNQQ